MKLFSRDSRGLAFSMDMLIALIPITIIIGMAAVSMDDMSYRSQSVMQFSSLDRVAADSADALVESSGTPVDWENKGTAKIPGLARFDYSKNSTEENVLSFSKISAFKESDLENLLGSNYGAYLVLTDSDSKVIKSVGTLNNSASNIVRVERLVLTSKLEHVTSLEGAIRNANSPRTYTTQFSTSATSSAYTNYWIIVENNGYTNSTIYVNNEPLLNSSEIAGKTLITKQINETFLKQGTDFEENIVRIVTGNGTGSMNVFVVGAPKNVPQSEINLENAKVKDAKFELFVWAR